MHIDEPHGNAWRNQRSWHEASPRVMRFGFVILRDARQDGESREGQNGLHQRRVLERACPVPQNGARRDSAPNAAAEVAQRLTAPVKAAHLDGPSRRARIQASLAKALQNAAKIRAGNPEGQ